MEMMMEMTRRISPGAIHFVFSFSFFFLAIPIPFPVISDQTKFSRQLFFLWVHTL